MLGLINEFSEVVGYNIHIQKSVAFFGHLLCPIRKRNYENNLIYNSIKKNKIHRDKFNKDVKDLYAENY